MRLAPENERALDAREMVVIIEDDALTGSHGAMSQLKAETMIHIDVKNVNHNPRAHLWVRCRWGSSDL